MTVRKRYLDREEIAELRKENEELKRQLAILPKKALENLSTREKSVYRFIEDHPGTSKQNVIDQLTSEGIGSRMTILKAINNLEEYFAIKRAPKEKPNIQVYKLYVNQDSTFWLVYRELDNFKNVFFDLIEKISKGSPQKKRRAEDNGLLYHLLLICHHILGVYLIYLMLKWQKEIHDRLILNKLHMMVIYNIVEIQAKLSEVFKATDTMSDFHRATVGQVSSPILTGLMHHMFLLEPDKMVTILADYRRHNLHQEIVPVLASAWEIGFPIYPYLNLNIDLLPDDMDKLKNWRHAIAYYLVNSKAKVDNEIWRILGDPSKPH